MPDHNWTPSHGQPLSPTELTVVQHMVECGYNHVKIGRLMGTEPNTVKSHQRRIAVKLGVVGLSCTSAAIVATAFRKGLLDGLVTSLARPTKEHRLDRYEHPYVIVHPDLTTEVMRTWAKPDWIK